MTKRAMFRFCLALFVLAVALVVVGLPTAENAYAIACCQQCQEGVVACRNSPSSSPCYGDFECCFDLYEGCRSHCTWCLPYP